MNRIGLLAIACLLLLTLPACGAGGRGAGPDDGRLSVVTSTSIIAALTREVAGDLAVVTSLVDPGADPHVYEPSPDGIRALSAADLVLVNGLGLDDYLLDDIEAASRRAPRVTVTDAIALIHAAPHAGDGSDEHVHGDVNPHVWMDPLRVKVMVDNIAGALARADPANADAYRDAASDYERTLDATDAEIRALIDQIPPANRKVVTNHDSFSYFAQRYGLEVVGTVIPGLSTEAEPSARQIAELVDLIDRESVKAIFIERGASSAIAERVAEDTGIALVSGLYTDQVGPAGSDAATVHGMLLENARKIREGLGRTPSPRAPLP